jgi:hypothetical protein
VLSAQPGGIPLRDDLLALAAEWQAPARGRRKPLAGMNGVLDRAVRCFARSRSFADGLQRALESPGSDRDAVCAAYGALAGAFHGEDAIDTGLRERVAGLAGVAQIAERLSQFGSARRGVTA